MTKLVKFEKNFYKNRGDLASLIFEGEDSLLSSLPQNSPLDYFLPDGNTQLKLLAPNSNPLLTTYLNQNKKSTRLGAIPILAERRGFEPPIGFPIHAFQACTLDHSDTSPSVNIYSITFFK